MLKKIRKSRGILFFLVAAGVAFPLYFVEGLASTIASYTASAITGIFLFTSATISLVFSTFADWFLRVTLSPDFINIPYTTGNKFVMYGWGVVRDIVNMFFIVVLIIIGLSTSLQMETYRWQKTLPRLVAVALLINFTPVVLGVFIDASNIMMNYFVNSLAEESIFVMRMRALYDTMATNLADAAWTSFSGAIITPVAMTVIFTLFNLFTGLLYAVYGAIFAMRYVAIWLLVIISPLGFFCYILPATQPFFRKWWNWFVGWCIAGIAGAFFLYLGEVMFQFIDQDAMIPPSTQHQGMEIGAFIQAFPLLIPLFFVFLGLVMTVTVSAAGAKGIVEGFQKASGATRKATQNLPGSNFKEKTQAASGAVKNAFRPEIDPGTSSSSASASSADTSPEGGTGKRSERRGGSLYRRDAGTGSESAGGGTTPRRPSATQVTTDASQGTQSAVESVASEFATNIEGGGAAAGKGVSGGASGTRTAGKKEEQKKCSNCGTTIAKNASFCKLCRKDTLSGGSSRESKPPSPERLNKEEGGGRGTDFSSSHTRRSEGPSSGPASGGESNQA